MGGYFRYAEGEPHQGVVHVLADGSLDPNFALGLRERPYAIALDGETLYVGGRVFEIDGETREGLAAFDASTGELLSWAPEVDNQISALAVHGDYVYVGGKFNNVNGESRQRIAAIQAAGTGAGEGEVTAWHPLPNGEVLALAVSGATLYAGGKFTQVESEEHKFLAAFDLSAGGPGEPELASWAPAGSNYVMAIAPSEDGETVYVGGEFTEMNGEAHGHIAAVKASDGSVVEAWAPSSNYRVRGFAVAGSTVYVAGEFTQFNSEERRSVVALEAEGSGALLPWNPDIIGGAAYSVAVSGGNVVVGGFFNGANGVARKNLAAIDLTTGEPTAWAPEVNGEVVSMGLSEDGKIAYVGGVFTQVNGESRSRFASIRTEDGALTAWAPDPNGTPKAIAVDGSMLYLGGGFGYIEGVNTWERLAAFEIEGEGATIVSGWKPKPNNDVEALAVDGEKLYVGGIFTQIGGSEHHDVAVLDKATGVADETWAPEPNTRVTSIAVAGSTLFIGGQFTSVDGETREHLAQIDGAGNLTAWAPEVNGEVDGVAFDGASVYAGGWFQSAGGVTRRHLAAFDATDGSLLDWNPGARDNVYGLEFVDSLLIATGAFHTVEYGPQSNLAVFAAPVLTVAKSGAGNGSVSSSPAGIECGSTCSSGFDAGQEVTLSATAAAGSEFAGWSGGGCSGTGSCVVTLNASASVTAQLAPASSPGGGGSEGRLR